MCQCAMCQGRAVPCRAEPVPGAGAGAGCRERVRPISAPVVPPDAPHPLTPPPEVHARVSRVHCARPAETQRARPVRNMQM